MKSEARIAILDLGRARFKASVWVGGAYPSCAWSQSVEVGRAIAAGEESPVIDSLRYLVRQARTQAEMLLIYGGSLLRQPEWQQALGHIARGASEGCFALTGEQEGYLLLLASAPSPSLDASLVDIGGGSVQLVRSIGVTRAAISSWQLGTFAIEERFGLSQGSPLHDYEAAIGPISKELRTEELRPCKTLLIGSNMMGTFMSKLAPRLGLPNQATWTIDTLERAWRYCAQLPPRDFAGVFPENPNFMYGADKAMFLAWVFTRELRPQEVSGTNASVAEGMARLAVDALRAGRPLTDLPFASATLQS